MYKHQLKNPISANNIEKHEMQLRAMFTRKSRVDQNARFVNVLGKNYANKFNN